MSEFLLSRRQAVAGLAASAAVPFLGASPALSVQAGPVTDAQAKALLDSIA